VAIKQPLLLFTLSSSPEEDMELYSSAPISISSPCGLLSPSKSDVKPEIVCPWSTTSGMGEFKWRSPPEGFENQDAWALITLEETVPDAPSREEISLFVRLFAISIPVVLLKRYSMALG